MSPVPRPETKLVYATRALRVYHDGDAAFLQTRGWSLLHVRRERAGDVAFHFPLEAVTDLREFRTALDVMRAERARVLTRHAAAPYRGVSHRDSAAR